MIILLVSLLAAALAAAEIAPESVQICPDVAKLPLVKQINESDASVEQKATSLQRSVADLKAKCAAYKANPTQLGSTLGDFQRVSLDTVNKNKSYQQAVALMLEQIGDEKRGARQAMELLEHKSCAGALDKAKAEEKARAEKIAAEAKAACDIGATNGMDSRIEQAGRANSDQASRAKSVGEMTSAGGGDMSTERVEKALTQRSDPQSRKDSAALLDQAEKYAKENGFPSPRSGAGDKVCGEACVSLLRAQSVQKTYGAESWQYQSLASTARNTNRGRFGSKP